ncbi:MAG: hypothetical protein JNK72_22545 [Myxococcales bacterium]|nr:hypothetical protein [Myxococcales bacterium]
MDAPAVDAPVVDAPAVDAPLADRPSVGDGGRALTGSLGTLVEAHAAAGTRRLVASGFEGVSRVCVGTRCLSGGLIP